MISDQQNAIGNSKNRQRSASRRFSPEKVSWDSLRLLVAVADAGSFRSAAVIAGVALNTIRSKLDHLERQFEAPLFKRGVAGVTLTPAGLQLVLIARQMKALVYCAGDIDLVDEGNSAEIPDFSFVRPGLLT